MKAISINILTTLDAKGAREAQQWIAQLTQAMKQAGASKGAGGDPFAPLGAGAQKAAGNVAQLQRAQAGLEAQQARLARTQGDTAQATTLEASAMQNLQQVLVRTDVSTAQAIATQKQLVGVQQQVARASQTGASAAQQFGDAMKSGLMGIVGPAALAAASIAAVGKAGELVQAGAQAQQTRLRFDALSESANTTGAALLGAMRAASAGTISDLNLELAANRAQLLGVADSAQEFATLMQIARARAQDMGISTTQAFNDLITGLGRGSALILDNLGITVSVTEANKVYAAQLGTTAGALTEAQQKQALINAVLLQGKASLDASGGAAETNAAKLERLGAQADNLKTAFGGELANTLGPIIDLLGRVAAASTEAGDGASQGSQGVAAFKTQLQESVPVVGGLYIALHDLQEAMAWFDSGGQQTAGGVSAVAPAMAAASTAANEAAIAAQQATAAYQGLAPATIATADAHAAGEHEARAFSVATADATMASLADAAAKQEQAAQTDLAAAEANAAATAFMALHPNITASGLASLATAGQINPLLAQLVLARIRAMEATAELARFRAMAGIAVQRNAPIADRAERDAFKHDNALRQRQESTAAATAAATAERRLQSVQGNEIPTIQHLRAEAEALKKTRGAGSADYINKLADIAQAEQRAESAAKKGRGGGGARAGGGAAAAKAAQATGDRIEDIARVSGNKLADIQEQAQQKIAAIDAKYAAQRIAAQQELNNQIAEMSASVKFDQTLDNFDAFQKDMTDAQRAAFTEREAAEVRYNERIAAAQDEARNEAVNGDADFAGERLKIREAQAKRQMEIEQRAAQANIDTNGKQQAAVAATAAAATKANEDQASTEIAIAQAKSQEKGAAEQAEKDAVAASAKEQADKVIAAAEESATKVRKASDSQRAAVMSNLQDQAAAVKAWADAIVSASNTAQTAMGSVTGPPTGGGGEAPPGDTEAAGGGTFVTHGPTTLTVGDNPGGAELVTVTPLSGKGRTRVGSGMARMAGGGALVAGGGGGGPVPNAGGGDVLVTLQQAVSYLAGILPLIKHQNELLKHVRTYQHTMQETIKVFADITTLHKSLAQPLPPIPQDVFLQLADEITGMMQILATKIDPNLAKSKRMFEHILAADTAAVAVFTEILNLRHQLATPSPPIVLANIQAMANEAMAIVVVLRDQLIVANQHQSDELERYATIVEGSVGILAGVADLRTRLSEDTGTAFDMGLVRGLAMRAHDIAQAVEMELIPYAEQQATELQAYADAAGAAVALLGDVADLRKQLSEGSGTPFDMNLLRGLAMRAAQILQLVQAQLIPTTEAQAGAMQHYADTAGSAVSILGGVADLRKQLSELTGGPFDMRVVQKLADEARRITQIVQAVLVPQTEATADGLSTYASAVESAVGIVRDVASLRKDATDLAGPVPVQAITALASEARQIAQIVTAVLIPTAEEQADGLSTYASAVGSAVSIVRDVASLRKDAADLAGPIPEKAIIALADDAKRITQIVMARMVPASEEEAAAARRFADTEGAAIQALKSVLDLPARLFADYQSPSNAQIDMAVKDANRIVQRVDQAARLYDTKGLDAAKAFSEAVGGTFTAFKEGLLFSEAIGSGDFRLDPKNLAVFEQGMAQTMATAGRLGQQAVAIPAANITALQNVTAALTASYDSMIRLNAVPFGNVGQLAGQFGGGGGGSSMVININNPPATMNVPATIQQIKQGLAQSLGGRR